MLSLHLSLNNPWYKNKFKNLWNKHGRITKNKSWEFEVIYSDYELFICSIEFTVRRDHAGLGMEIGLFGYSIDFKIYDNRHWNDTTNSWE